jgi:radical SAM family uncharacterized protein/radical SAM-linked protein
MSATITEADLIRRVSKPFRYIGGERNAIVEDLSQVAVRFALVYPDVYEVGMSHLGLRILYHVLNEREDTACERVFSPWTDMQGLMVERGDVLRSIESGLPLREFDLVGITLQHELNYTNILGLLDLGGVPLLSRERGAADPFVIAGGPCALNPAPLAEVFDAFALGDGEEVVNEIVDAFRAWRREGSRPREGLLEGLAEIEGVYVPLLHDRGVGPRRIRRRVVSDLDSAAFPTRQIVPFGEIVHDRAMVEVMRGCSRGCRFCHAGFAYRPVRRRRLETLKRQCDEAIASTGYEQVVPLALNCPDYPHIAELLGHVMTAHAAHRVSMSLPSLRMDTFSIDLAEMTQGYDSGTGHRAKKTGLTFAPEAGSQRLRDVVNKNVSGDDILQTTRTAFERGWTRLKLYFMIGLPTETPEDVCAIGDLVRRIEAVGLDALGPRRGRLKIAVSVNVFVPKAHTPFQFAQQAKPEEVQEKVGLLRAKLRGAHIKLSYPDGRSELVEGAFSRGGRELGPVLLSAYRLGCAFDGWREHFDFGKWQEAFAEHGLNLEAYATRAWAPDEPPPWAHIDVGVSEGFLKREAERAMAAATTPDCSVAGCQGCGVADEETCPGLEKTTKEPRSVEKHRSSRPRLPSADGGGEDARWQAVIRFAKRPPAHLLSHREMARAIERAARRAGLPLAYSEGYAPRPRIRYALALPLGVTSEDEWASIELTEEIGAEEAGRRLGAELPPGLAVLHVETRRGRAPRFGGRFRRARYDVDVLAANGGEPSRVREAIAGLLGRKTLIITRRSHKGERVVDLRPFIYELAAAERSRGRFCFQMVLGMSEDGSAKPEEVIQALSDTSGPLQVLRVHRSALLE